MLPRDQSGKYSGANNESESGQQLFPCTPLAASTYLGSDKRGDGYDCADYCGAGCDKFHVTICFEITNIRESSGDCAGTKCAQVYRSHRGSLRSHQRAFRFFVGVTATVVPDNVKIAVTLRYRRRNRALLRIFFLITARQDGADQVPRDARDASTENENGNRSISIDCNNVSRGYQSADRVSETEILPYLPRPD